jgi:hypothetical protein
MSDNSKEHRAVLVYILAASHSGSTLTAMLLNAHPDICTAGELKANNLGDTNEYRCSCQALINECHFWRDVAEEMRQRGLNYDVRSAGTSLRDIPNRLVQRLLRPLHRGRFFEAVRDGLLSMLPAWHANYGVWRDRNLNLVQSIGHIAGASYVADSSKIGIRLKYLRRLKGLEVKVLRVVRDGRAVSLTYMDPGNFADANDPGLRGGGSGKDEEFHHRLTMEQAATEWRRSNEEAEAVLATVPTSDWLQVTYEGLCRDTEATMQRVHAFLGLEYDNSYENFRDARHHIVGNGMRLDTSSEIRLDDRWLNELSEGDLAEFDRIAGHLNRKYGYR